MKKPSSIFHLPASILALVFSVLVASAATPVYFPVLLMTGATNDVVINVRAINNPVIYNGGLYYMPVNGTNLTTVGGNVTNSFIVGGYTASIAGIPRSWRFYVTNSATPISVINLMVGDGITVYNDGSPLGALTNRDTRAWTNMSSLWLNNFGKLVNGNDNIATGIGAHAEGVTTIASGDYAHAEGNSTVAAGAASHADGVLGAVTANWAYLWNGDNANPATNATQGRFQVKAPGGILLEGVVTGDGSGLTNLAGGGGGSATNVFFLNSPSVSWSTTSGSNVATVVSDFSTNLSPIHLLTSTKRPGQSYSPGNFGGAVVTNSGYLLVAPPGTAGVCRELFIMPDVGTDAGLNSCINDLRLLVFADSNLTVNVSLGELWGMRYHARTGDSWQVHRRSRYINSFVDTQYYLSYPFPLYQASLKFPMPFTNGMFCKITNSVGGSNWTAGYITAYSDFSPIPTSLNEYRMYCYSTNKAPSGASNFWTSVTGSGQIVGITFGCTNTDPNGLIGFEDSQGFGFWLNNSFKWEPDGMDDFFHSTFGGSLGLFIGEDVGVTTWDYTPSTPYNHEGYRWLYNDSINFTNGFTFYTDGGDLNNAYFNLWYYRKP